MCGIAGWYAWGSNRPDPATIRGLLLANQERGLSAAGMAWLRDGDIYVAKQKGPAVEFIKATPNERFLEVAASPRGLLHTRATTKGSEDVNSNNHPVVGLGWLVTHNGSITNDDDLWGYYTAKEGVARFADVDTSAIPLMLSRGVTLEDSIAKLTALAGSATLAAWAEQDPERILLARFGYNDLYLFHDVWSDILYWSSSPSAAFLMRGSMMGRHKFLNMSRLADNRVLVLGPGGLTAARDFKVTPSPFFVAKKVVVRPLPPAPPVPGSQSSAASPTSSGVPSSDLGALSKRQAALQTGKNHVRVVFNRPTSGSIKSVAAVWRQMEEEPSRPFPLSDNFSPTWWHSEGTLQALQGAVLGITKETGYGRWIITRRAPGDPPTWEFRPLKRVKQWWDRIYRTKFTFPREIAADGKTDLDEHLCWEHYDIQLQKQDNSTTMLLGFMCPWCGVWISSRRLQELGFRCDFCAVRSRGGAQCPIS